MRLRRGGSPTRPRCRRAMIDDIRPALTPPGGSGTRPYFLRISGQFLSARWMRSLVFSDHLVRTVVL